MYWRYYNRPQKISKELLKEAVEYFASVLFSKQLAKNLQIRIYFVDKLYQKEEVYGDCVAYDFFGTGKYREFEIRVDGSKPLNFILKTIGHELTHVKQYAEGRLKDFDRTNQIRYGKEIYLDKTNLKDVEYYTLPWEIEAYGYEYCLFQSFKEYQKRK